MEFPDAWLVPSLGRLQGPDEEGFYAIDVPLEPFEMDGELVDTSIRLDFVPLPVPHAQAATGREFSVPVNPQDGAIDASVYLDGRHNPIDVTEIAFGRVKDGTVDVTLTMRILFEFEGSDFADRDAVLEAILRLPD